MTTEIKYQKVCYQHLDGCSVLLFQCHFCDKAFMNQAFLQSHIQRRHPEDSHLGKWWAQLQRTWFFWFLFLPFLLLFILFLFSANHKSSGIPQLFGIKKKNQPHTKSKQNTPNSKSLLTHEVNIESFCHRYYTWAIDNSHKQTKWFCSLKPEEGDTLE